MKPRAIAAAVVGVLAGVVLVYLAINPTAEESRNPFDAMLTPVQGKAKRNGSRVDVLRGKRDRTGLRAKRSRSGKGKGKGKGGHKKQRVVRNGPAGVSGGRWTPAPEDDDATEMLEAIGYVDGSVDAPPANGVLRWDREKTWDSLNFLTSGSGGATLMTMEGEVLHSWHGSFGEVADRASSAQAGRKHWRRAVLLPDGSVIGIFEGKAIFRLDKDSNVLWVNPNRAHHDLQIMDDGTLFALKRRGVLHPELHPTKHIAEDFLVRMDIQTGEELGQWSLLDAVRNADPAYAAKLVWRQEAGDIFHTNTVHILDGSAAAVHPAFQKGRLLTSMRQMSAIAVVDLEENRVVWAHRGAYRLQHDPTVVSGGRVMLFDNAGLKRQRSRVLTFQLPGMAPATVIEGTEAEPFHSRTCGTASELPNGNVLVTESDRGRAFEVDKDGTVVWEYLNPHRAGKEGRYIAALFEVVRLPRDFPVTWAETAE